MPQEEKSIIRSLIDPTIPLDEISFNDTEEGTDDVNGGAARGKKIQKEVGNVFPLIQINDYVLQQDEVEKLTIDNTGFLPTIDIRFTLGSSPSTFLTTSMPKDGDRVNVFIRARDDAFKPIRNDYLVTDVSTSKGANNQGDGMTIRISGELFVPGINDERIVAVKGSSVDALEEIAESLGLGFATNETSTADEQTWICGNDTYVNFIQHIVSSAWKDEKSYYSAFIDVYYHLNFVNVGNQFSDSTEIDDALVDTLFTQDTLEGEEISMSKEKKVFTNIEERQGTNMYISNYRIINNSSDISKRYGYKMHCEFFEQNSLEKWDIYAEPIITPGTENEKILLKGKAGEDFYKTQIKKRWAGIQYSSPEHNVHENYLYSQVHNLINTAELEKLKLEIEVPRANFNIYRGERIPCVLLSSGNPMKTAFMEQEEEIKEGGEFAKPGRPVLDKIYSGFYMIQGMIFKYEARNPNKTDEFGHFTEEVIMTRREWPTP